MNRAYESLKEPSFFKNGRMEDFCKNRRGNVSKNIMKSIVEHGEAIFSLLVCSQCWPEFLKSNLFCPITTWKQIFYSFLTKVATEDSSIRPKTTQAN